MRFFGKSIKRFSCIAQLCIVHCALCIITLGCHCSKPAEEAEDSVNRECLYQVSTIQALVAGDYHGSTTVRELLKHGDFGIGTFEGVNGEMIVLDGVCYQALADSLVRKASSTAKVPFAAVTFFDADYQLKLKGEYDFYNLRYELDSLAFEMGANTFYAVRIEGDFAYMKVRSVVKQKEPYVKLDKAVKTGQRVFEYRDIKGTLIALYCPPYASGVNVAGWHVHFLSEACDRGGHVIDLMMREGVADIDRTNEFCMVLPETEYFNKLNLTAQEQGVNEVEAGN